MSRTIYYFPCGTSDHCKIFTKVCLKKESKFRPSAEKLLSFEFISLNNESWNCNIMKVLLWHFSHKEVNVDFASCFLQGINFEKQKFFCWIYLVKAFYKTSSTKSWIVEVRFACGYWRGEQFLLWRIIYFITIEVFA